MSQHGLLTLSESSKNNNVVPKLRDVTLRASVYISDHTLLEYQHDLRTNSTYFNIRLTLDPANSEISAFQQYFIVNGLRDEFMLELDYDNTIIASATDEDAREKLLVQYAEQICNEKISQELNIAEILLSSDGTDFMTCVAEKIDNILDRKIDIESKESVSVSLVEKSSHTYLEWFPLIESCTEALVEAVGLDLNEFSTKIPFEFIDTDKVKPLGSILGEIYEGTSSWTPYKIQTRKYHVGSVRICSSARISEEQIKTCIAHCAASFFRNLAKSPIGLKFDDSVADLQLKYISVAQKYITTVESINRKRKIANTKQATEFAGILIDKIGAGAERLKLAMEQDLPFFAIYYDCLTSHIRTEIETRLKRDLKEIYACNNVSDSSSISFAGPDWHGYSQHIEIGRTNSPKLLTLRVSKILAGYFDEHPWLTELNIKQPEVIMLAEYEARDNGSEAITTDEYIVVKNYFYGDLIPRNSEMIVDIKRIVLEFDDEEEQIPIHE